MDAIDAHIVFETERLRVRHFNDADIDNYFALQGNPQVMQYIRAPRTSKESDSFFNEKIIPSSKEDFKGYWAVEKKDSREFIGCFVIIPLPDEPDKTQLGYSFLPDHWGNGYATEVTRKGVDYFHNRTPLTEIFGVTETANIASQKVLQKAGFNFKKFSLEHGKELTIFIIEKN